MQRLNNDINIFVVTHKVFKYPLPIDGRIHTPLQAGTGANLGYLQENRLDNIAHKNANFCELTALYFIWKNVRCRYAGLVHYRRFFCSRHDRNRIVEAAELERILTEYDVVVPNPRPLSPNVRAHYAHHHKEKDWDETRRVIAERQPDYLAAFDEIATRERAHYANMLITRKALLDQYCEWLFDILFELERRTDLSGYNPFQARIFGFLSERLLNVWLLKNKLRCYPLPIYDGKIKSFVAVTSSAGTVSLNN